MFRAVMLTSLALVAATVAAYRLSGAVPRADFAYVNQTAINTLDPAAVTWNQDIRVALNVWEGLAVRSTDAAVRRRCLPTGGSTRLRSNRARAGRTAIP